MQLLPGTHTLLDFVPLQLTKEDSHTIWRGTTDKPFATISGGVQLTNWKVASNSDGGTVWEAPWTLHKTPHQLFVDGERQPRARSPANVHSFHQIERPIFAAGSATTATAATSTPAAIGLVYAEGPGTAAMPSAAFGSTRAIECTYFASYCTNTVRVAAIFPQNRTVLFAEHAYWSQVDVGNTSRFYIEGLVATSSTKGRPSVGLAPGQWYIDAREGEGQGTIRYSPYSGQTISNTTVVASVATELLRVDGAEDLQFEGIRFMHADGDRPNQPADCQAAITSSTAAVHITGSSGITIDRCTVTSVRSFGVWAYRNSSDVVVTGSTFQDVGAGGIRLGDGPVSGPPNQDWNLRLAVNDTLVEQGGRLMAGAPGILVLGNVYNFSLTHNIVAGFPWSGISAGSVSSFAARSANGADYNTTASVAACRRNRLPWQAPPYFRNTIAYNKVQNIAMGPDRLSDNGGIYVPALNVDVHHNEVSNISSYAREVAGKGVYGEGGGCNCTVHHNIFHDIVGACVDIHWYGVNAAIINNVCEATTGADPSQAMIGALHTTGGAFNLTVTRNIIFLPIAARPREPYSVVYGGTYCMQANLTKHHVGDLGFVFGTVDRNVYYAAFNTTLRFPDTTLPCRDSAAHGADFATWRLQTGHDGASVVGVNPGFVGNGDYALRPDSPARRMGIESIDTSKIGVLTPHPMRIPQWSG